MDPEGRDIRLDGLADAIQEILDLAGLLPNGIERARILGRGGRAELRSGAKAVASRTPCCHAGRELSRTWDIFEGGRCPCWELLSLLGCGGEGASDRLGSGGGYY